MEKVHIDTLIHSNPKEIGRIYNDNRDSFLFFGKKYGLDYDDLTDIYQEAFIALRNHALNGKLNEVNSSLKTYLFGIGKFMIYDLLKERKKTTSYEPNFHIQDGINTVLYENEQDDLSIQQHLLKKYFTKLGKKCQEMLTLFYSRGLSIDDIVEHSNYTSNNVVRSQKSRCIKTLKEMIKS